MRAYKWYERIKQTNLASVFLQGTKNFNEWVIQNLPYLYLKDRDLFPLYLFLSLPVRNVISYDINDFPFRTLTYDDKSLYQLAKAPIDYDMIIRFENLEADIKRLSQHINIKPKDEFYIKENDSLKEYHQHYSVEAHQMIEKLYKIDLDYFNYDF